MIQGMNLTYAADLMRRSNVYDQIDFKKAYYDEHTGEQLPEELVRAAIIGELNYFSEEGVWDGRKMLD